MSEDAGVDISQQQADAAPIPVTEKMVPQSEVTKAIVAAKMRAREEAETQYRQSQSQAGSMGGMQQPQGFDKAAFIEEMRETWKQDLERERQEEALTHQKRQVEDFAKDYMQRMKQGVDTYEDFEKVTSKYKPGAFPQVTVFAAQQDNLPDIIYELSNNPQKLANLHVLAMTNDELAREEMTKLSQSIKQNKEALQSNTKTPAPLSRVKHSVTAGADNGKKSIKDLRKQSYLKV